VDAIRVADQPAALKWLDVVLAQLAVLKSLLLAETAQPVALRSLLAIHVQLQLAIAAVDLESVMLACSARFSSTKADVIRSLATQLQLVAAPAEAPQQQLLLLQLPLQLQWLTHTLT